MLGLVDYSDSEDELVVAVTAARVGKAEPERRASTHGENQGAEQAGDVKMNPPAVNLPSAAFLFSEDGTEAAGTKRMAPQTRIPNRAAQQPAAKMRRPNEAAKDVATVLQRRRQSGTQMLPPQLGGRSNVATQDLSFFTSKTLAAQRQQMQPLGKSPGERAA
jgi:hypothetical protein